MPHVLSKDKRYVTYAENKKVVKVLDMVAAMNGKTRSAVITEAIEAYIKKHWGKTRKKIERMGKKA